MASAIIQNPYRLCATFDERLTCNLARGLSGITAEFYFGRRSGSYYKEVSKRDHTIERSRTYFTDSSMIEQYHASISNSTRAISPSVSVSSTNGVLRTATRPITGTGEPSPIFALANSTRRSTFTSG